MYDSERSLLREVAAGSEQAFRQLFDRYHQQLGRYVFRITHSKELSEEIVQDAFVKIWMNHKALDRVQNFRAYLFILSKNHTLNYLRKLTRELLRENKWKEEVMHSNDHDNTPDVYYRLLDEAIDRLPPQQQKVYLLSRHERLKYAEIAARLQISPETVKSYLKTATAFIKNYVISHFEITASFFLFYINY